MRATKAISIILAITTLICCLSVISFAEETQQSGATVSQGYHSIDAAASYLGTDKLVDNVGATVLYEMNSDTLMYAWNADEHVYPSSLVKIMTALIAVQKADPQTVVTVSQSALDTVPYYAASVDLQQGEEITLSDLLYCMMVGSANDAAAVIAEHIFGSQTAFVKEMNDYAVSLGCRDTQFVNVHGLHDENQYTTARDLARILSAAVKNEAFMTYFSAVTYLVPATNKSEARELSTGNFLMNTENLQLYYDSRVTGGRTGIADDDSRCLATVAEKNGMQVISVVLGSESTLADDGKTQAYGSFRETSLLLDACFDDCHVVQVLYEGQVLKQCPVINGENDVVLASLNSVYSVLPLEISAANLIFKYEDTPAQIEAPVTVGQVLSNVQVWYNGFCVAQTALVAKNDVRFVSPQTVNEEDTSGDDISETPFVIIISVVAGVVGLLLLIRGVRYLRLIFSKKRGNQIRQDRRRSR